MILYAYSYKHTHTHIIYIYRDKSVIFRWVAFFRIPKMWRQHFPGPRCQFTFADLARYQSPFSSEPPTRQRQCRSHLRPELGTISQKLQEEILTSVDGDTLKHHQVKHVKHGKTIANSSEFTITTKQNIEATEIHQNLPGKTITIHHNLAPNLPSVKGHRKDPKAMAGMHAVALGSGIEPQWKLCRFKDGAQGQWKITIDDGLFMFISGKSSPNQWPNYKKVSEL